MVNYLFEEEDYAERSRKSREKGVKAVAIKADVSKFNEVETMMKETVETFGSIDVCLSITRALPATAFWPA